MPYVKQNFSNGNVLNASQLNHIETGIIDTKKEILDSIEIIVNKAMEDSTKIQNGNVLGVTGNTCTIEINGKTFTNIPYYGNEPVVNKQYRVFIPDGNMSRAFIYTMQGSSVGASIKLDYVRPEDFGAKADGVNDDTAAFSLAIQDMLVKGIHTLKLADKRYYVKDLVITDSIHITGEQGTVITGDGGHSCIFFDYRSPRRVHVTGITAGDYQTTFTLSDQIPADIQRGDTIKIYANGADDNVPGIRYPSHIGEFLTIFEINREANTITVTQNLRYDYKPDGGCVYLMLVEKKHVEMDNVSLEIATDAVEAKDNNVGAIHVMGGSRHHFHDITVRNLPESAFRMDGCYGYTFERINAIYQQNSDVFNDQKGELRQLGYTITDQGGGYFKICNCLCNNIRHFSDTGTANKWQQRFDESGNVVCEGGEVSGVSEYGLISNIIAHGASGFALGTHENTYQVTYDNIVDTGNNGDGFIVRGDRVILRNSYVEATNNGLFISNYTDESGDSTSISGHHVFENLEVRVPPSGAAFNDMSDVPLYGVFKNCTFYGNINFNAKNSHYQFYKCQFFNSIDDAKEHEESGLNIEAANVRLDFYDCDFEIRIQPRLGENLNFTNCHITNTYNQFIGNWTDYHINFINCVIEGPPGQNKSTYMNFTSTSHCNVLFEGCVMRHTVVQIDMAGDELSVSSAHKRFKVVNTTCYPGGDTNASDGKTSFSAIFYIKCSCTMYMDNVVLLCDPDINRWNAGLIALSESNGGVNHETIFATVDKVIKLNINGVGMQVDDMSFNGPYNGYLINAEDCGTLKGYIRNISGESSFSNGVKIIENEDNIQQNEIVIEKATQTGSSATADTAIPAVTTEDNGKILQVSNGEWAAVSVQNAESVKF